jgi:hypothetical protein
MDIKINNIIITGKNRFSLKQQWYWLNLKLLSSIINYLRLRGVAWTIRRDLLLLSGFKKGFRKNSPISG